MKKIFEKCLLSLAMFVALFTIIAPTASAKTTYLQVESYQAMNFEVNGITIQGKTKLNDSGWKLTNFGAHRSTVIDHGEVMIDGNIHTIENGKVTGVSDISSIVGKKIYDVDNTMSAIVKKTGDNYTAKFNINANEMLESKSSNDHELNNLVQTQSYGKIYKNGDWVHCNRFNGPGSDGGHYKKTHWRAAVNFAGSDCDMALVRSTKCWGHNYCNQSGPAGGCSSIIGHSRRYHSH